MPMPRPPKGWQPVGLVEPPVGMQILVWNGDQSIARFRRGKFIAQADSTDMHDVHEEPWVIHGVTYWAHLSAPPK
jgi:hypothetical protein